jgi:AmmeMemoRadiSam system protein B
MSGVREPAVAGRFYEGGKEALTASIRGCFLHSLGPGSLPEISSDGPGLIDALVSPHAGYMFSGPAAAHAFAALAADGIPETAIILGPSHYATARRGAVSLAKAWRTPLGQVPVDLDLGRRLIETAPLLDADDQSHRAEHSLEVQVPFLQFIYGDRVPKICPICIRSYPVGEIDPLIEDAKALGEAIAHTVGARRALIIASTDFSHHIPHSLAERQDRLALDAVLALDPEALLRTVYEMDISMCGPVPVAIALFFCLARGPHRPELLRYYTSGDIIGDRNAVVGYASLVIRRSGGDLQ